MKLTTRGQYASRAMLDLAERYHEGAVVIEEIARRQGIPKKYLERLLLDLKGAGLVQSIRGRQGGYRLLRPPQEITLGEVVRAMEGPIAPLACVDEDAPQPCDCPCADVCGLRTVWAEVRDAIAGVLDNTSLETIRQRTEKLREQQAGQVMYYI